MRVFSQLPLFGVESTISFTST